MSSGAMAERQTTPRQERFGPRVRALPTSESFHSCRAIARTDTDRQAAAKRSEHAAQSLPDLVEKLVKNWEIEASYKTDLKDWRTVDTSNYSFSVNGGPPQSGEHMLQVGTYNAIIEPNEFYCPFHSSFDASHKTFKRMMPTFAWEVLEVYSGPPQVSFRWRHWGTMNEDYVGVNE